MFNLGAISFILIHTALPLQKKLELIKLGFRHLVEDEKLSKTEARHVNKLLDRVNNLATIRNVIAHSSFEEVPTVDGTEAGIEFSYFHKGEMRIPGRAKRQKDNESLQDTLITFTQFDNYDADASGLVEKLVEIAGHCERVDEGLNILPDIANIIAASDNILTFRNSKLDK